MIRRNEAAAAVQASKSNIMPMKFGQRMGMSQAPEVEAKAEIWLNIGYETGDPEYPLITLPFGIPIDTQGESPLRGQNPKFLAFTKRKNELLKQIQAAGAKLAPGEEAIIGGTEGGLVLQLRRRATDSADLPVDEDLLPAFELNLN